MSHPIAWPGLLASHRQAHSHCLRLCRLQMRIVTELMWVVQEAGIVLRIGFGII